MPIEVLAVYAIPMASMPVNTVQPWFCQLGAKLEDDLRRVFVLPGLFRAACRLLGSC